MKRKWILLLFVVVLLLAPAIALAEQPTSIEKLDTISDEALQMVKSQRYDDAKKLLDYFTDQFPKLANRERPLTLDQLRIVNVSRNEAVDATVNPNMKYEEKINKLTKFRLVIDALASNKRPLWTGMKDQIMTAFHQVRAAADHNDAAQFNSHFNSFLSLYNMVYPSMKIDVPAETIQQLDTRINFVDDYRMQIIGNDKKSQELAGIETDLKRIFDHVDEDQTDPSLWWVIISTGSIIIMTLSYVGFRKYQGDKETKKNRSRESKN
ncbi:sporulation protein YpjB [Bacillota bacterium Lsc_1132]